MTELSFSMEQLIQKSNKPQKQVVDSTIIELYKLEFLSFTKEDPMLWLKLAEKYRQRGLLTEAEYAYRQILIYDPANPSAIGLICKILMQQMLPYSTRRFLEECFNKNILPEILYQTKDVLAAQFPYEKVSIYTPGYASEAFIRRCLESILSQTYPIHEIILVDDCSPDRSTEIAKEYGVKIYYHSENKGLAASCNTALSYCTGDFLAKIDTDLELDPTWLEKAMLDFNSHDVAGVGGRLYEYKSMTIPDQFRRLHMSQHWGDTLLVNYGGLFGADCIFRVTALKAVNGWDEKYRTNFEDKDLSIRLLKAGYKFIYEPSAGARHLRQDSIYNILSNTWNWRYPEKEDIGWYDSIPAAVSAIADNRFYPFDTLNTSLRKGAYNISYISFLIHFCWSFRDLHYVFKNNRTSQEAFMDTAKSLFMFMEYDLYSANNMSTKLTSCVLNDTKSYISKLIPSLYDHINSDVYKKNIEVALSYSQDIILDYIYSLYPEASTHYLIGYKQTNFLNRFTPETSTIVEYSMNLLHEEEKNSNNKCIAKCLFINPSPRNNGLKLGETDVHANLRWYKTEENLQEIFSLMKVLNFSVQMIDAVDLRYCKRDVYEQVIGFAPDFICYSAFESSIVRILDTARWFHYQKLNKRIEKPFSQILFHAPVELLSNQTLEEQTLERQDLEQKNFKLYFQNSNIFDAVFSEATESLFTKYLNNTLYNSQGITKE